MSRLLFLAIFSIFLYGCPQTNSISFIFNKKEVAIDIPQKVIKKAIREYNLEDISYNKNSFGFFYKKFNKTKLQKLIDYLSANNYINGLSQSDIEAIKSILYPRVKIIYLPKKCKINSTISKYLLRGKRDNWIAIDNNIEVTFNKKGCATFEVLK
jgi:hypothetical protein